MGASKNKQAGGLPEFLRIAQEKTDAEGFTIDKEDIEDTTQAGIKYDTGKPRFDLIPAKPMLMIAEVYTIGATKYADRNWEKGIAYSRIYGAVQRHLNAYWSGQDLDEESALPHLAHAAWGLLALLEYSDKAEQYGLDLDDRP